MKKVTVPARRIHNTSHQSTSVAACHMREKRWEGDKSEKGHSIVRTSTSIDQTKCWQCCSCEYVHTDHQHRPMCVATSCAASRPSSTPTIAPGHIQHNQPIIQHHSMSYTRREVVEGGSEGERHCHDNITSANQTMKCWRCWSYWCERLDDTRHTAGLCTNQTPARPTCPALHEV